MTVWGGGKKIPRAIVPTPTVHQPQVTFEEEDQSADDDGLVEGAKNADSVFRISWEPAYKADVKTVDLYNRVVRDGHFITGVHWTAHI